jgi:hypothetical protein
MDVLSELASEVEEAQDEFLKVLDLCDEILNGEIE